MCRGKLIRISVICAVVYICGMLQIAEAQTPCEIKELLAFDGEENDEFGEAVAVSFPYVFVGVQFDDENGGQAGAVWLYRFEGAEVVEETKLLASDGQSGDHFGGAIAADSSVLVVGAHRTRNQNGDIVGSAYVFRLIDGIWVEEAKLSPLDVSQSDFGISVAVDGDLVIAGSIIEDAAYVFRHDGSIWNEEAKLVASGGQFGISVAIHNSLAVVGENNTRRGSDEGNGYAYVFRETGGQWVEEVALEPDAPTLQSVGDSVDIDGDAVYVSGIGTGGETGAVYQFEYDQQIERWQQIQKIESSSSSETSFGFPVSVNGNSLITGAHSKNNRTGSAYLFEYDGNEWSEYAVLRASDGEEEDRFGFTVGIDQDFAVVGAYLHDGWGFHSGSAYVYSLGELCAFPVIPDSFTRIRGLPVSGVLEDVYESDDSRLNTRPDVFRATTIPPVQIEFVGTSPITSLTEMTFILESRCSVDLILQEVLLFDYVQQDYVTVDLRIAGQSDSATEIIVTDNPSRFVNQNTNEVKALIRHNAVAFSIVPTWVAGIDQAIWKVSD